MAEDTENQPPKIGDTVNTAVVRDPKFRYVAADSVVVTHMPVGDMKVIELQALTMETALLHHQLKITSIDGSVGAMGESVGILATPQHIHKASIRLSSDAALNMLGALIAHMKAYKLHDMGEVRNRLNTALDS